MRSPSTGSAKMAGDGATLSRGLSLQFFDPVCGLSFLAFFVCFLCFSFVGKFFCFLCLTPLAFLVIFVACKAGGMALWWWIYWALAVHLHLGISLSWFVLIIVFPGFHWKSLMFPGLRFIHFFCMFFLISGALAYVSLATECLYQAIAPDDASLDLPSVRANLRVAYQEFLALISFFFHSSASCLWKTSFLLINYLFCLGGLWKTVFAIQWFSQPGSLPSACLMWWLWICPRFRHLLWMAGASGWSLRSWLWWWVSAFCILFFICCVSGFVSALIN